MKRFAEFLYEAVLATQGSLGIARQDMPQIKEKDIEHFLSHLQSQNISVTTTQVRIEQLKPTQKELNLDRVREKKNIENPKPYIISKDFYILDGHHQWMSMRMTNPMQEVDAFIVNLGMLELLNIARTYERTTFKTLDGEIQ